jgi:F-type H+-transporting ATPase subunit d
MIYGTDVGGVETIAALQAFRKRHSDATRSHATAHSQPTTVDFNHYRAILKNKAVVDDAEKLFNEFKFVSYDANAHIAAIESFEAKAVAKAQETEKHIDVELEDLQATLKNIESARPFEDLTVEDVAAAHPRILEAVQTMIRKGKWTVPGTLSLSSFKPFFLFTTAQVTKKNLETCRYCRTTCMHTIRIQSEFKYRRWHGLHRPINFFFFFAPCHQPRRSNDPPTLSIPFPKYTHSLRDHSFFLYI